MSSKSSARWPWAPALATIITTAACGGGPSGPGDEVARLSFVDGPADHVTGEQIPPFRIWILDGFGRRATNLSGGSIAVELLAPDGSVHSQLGSVPMEFGEGKVAASISLPAGPGYSARASYQGTTSESPPFAVVSGRDVVRLSNPPAGEVGLLVDGANNIGVLGDSVHRTSTTFAAVGVFDSGALTQGVAVFAADRRPEMVPVSWTAGVDTLSIALRDRVPIPVTVWVIGGDFAVESASVETGLAGLDEVWRGERVGVTIADIEFRDATQHVDQFGIFNVAVGATFGTMGAAVGRDFDRFNIYVVNEIRTGAGQVGGFAQTGTALAATPAALVSGGVRLLGHEFGHAFGLGDAPNVTGFDGAGNIMAVGQTSTVFTEGQTFRAHFHISSPLRQFRTDDAFETITCRPVDATTHCPWLALRIWPETEPAP